MKGEFQFFPPTLPQVYLPSLHPPNLVMSSFWLGHRCVSSVTVHAVHSSLFIFGEPWWLYLPAPHPHPMVSRGLSDFHLGSCLYASPALGCLHTARSGMSPWACRFPSSPATSSAFCFIILLGLHCIFLGRCTYWFLETSSFLVFSLTSNFLRKDVEKNSFLSPSWYQKVDFSTPRLRSQHVSRLENERNTVKLDIYRHLCRHLLLSKGKILA